MANQKGGQVKITTAPAMLHLAFLYNHLEAIAQAVENGLDADAKRIWVVLEANRIIVTDNGHGMVPEILAEDEQLITYFHEEILRRKIAPSYDIREVISRPSLHSLKWMMECFAFSPKVPSKNLRGMRGIGSVAWLVYGQKAMFYTRPETSLAYEWFVKRTDAWKQDVTSLDPVPTFFLRPPTELELHGGVVNFDVEQAVDHLKDPWGNELLQGTSVEVTELRENTHSKIQPHTLSEYLEHRYGRVVALAGAELIVIDRQSDESQQTLARELTYSIKPPLYTGSLFLDEQITVAGRQARINLFYDPDGSKGVIDVQRLGSGVLKLLDLPEFKRRKPWNLPQISGFIEFPFHESDYWDTAKTGLKDTPEFKEWVKALRSLEDRIMQEVQDNEDQLHDERKRQISSEVADALLKAMAEIESLTDKIPFAIPVAEDDNEHHTTTPRGKNLPEVQAAVLNEHHQGVSGIDILLMQDGKAIARRTTKSSGHVNFGEQKRGLYSLKMIVPLGTIPASLVEQPFEITAKKKWYHAIFKLTTGDPKPPEIKRPKHQHLIIIPMPLSNPNLFYSLEKYEVFGTIIVNTKAGIIDEAWERGDYAAYYALFAEAACQGIAQYGFAEHPPELRHQESARLFSLLFKHLNPTKWKKLT